MYTLECHVGRLFEIRVQPPLAVEELKGFHPQVVRILGRVPGQLIGCTDLRRARVFNLDVADRLMAIIRAEAPRVERNAYLVGESAVFSMQIARVIRAAGIPSRRAFTSTEEAVTWLTEVLSEAELRRLREFIAAGEGHP